MALRADLSRNGLLTLGSMYVSRIRSINFASWYYFQNSSNVQKVEERTRRKFKSANPALSTHSSYPVTFANTPSNGYLRHPFPGQYLVIIALENLTAENGLPTNISSKGLSTGEDVLIDGSEELWFTGRGGGKAVFLILDLEK
jgi:hypothetical protein